MKERPGTALRLRGSTSTLRVGMGQLKIQREVSRKLEARCLLSKGGPGRAGAMRRGMKLQPWLCEVEREEGTRPSEVGATLCGGPFSMAEGLGWLHELPVPT